MALNKLVATGVKSYKSKPTNQSHAFNQLLNKTFKAKIK